MDAFDVGRKAAAEWAELAARGLRRVYIGMESGDDALLRFLLKPGAAADVIDAVTTLKGGRHRGQHDHHDRHRRRSSTRPAMSTTPLPP